MRKLEKKEMLQSISNLPDSWYQSNFFQDKPTNIIDSEELIKKCSHIVEKQFYDSRMFRPCGCPGPMVMSFNLERNQEGTYVDQDYSTEIQQVFEPVIEHVQNTLGIFSKRPFQLSINIYNDSKHSLAVL